SSSASSHMRSLPAVIGPGGTSVFFSSRVRQLCVALWMTPVVVRKAAAKAPSMARSLTWQPTRPQPVVTGGTCAWQLPVSAPGTHGGSEKDAVSDSGGHSPDTWSSVAIVTQQCSTVQCSRPARTPGLRRAIAFPTTGRSGTDGDGPPDGFPGLDLAFEVH